MSMLKVACEDQRLYLVESTTIASGGVNETRVLFNFCPLWDGYAKTAVFYRNMREPYYAMVNDENIALIPWEVVKDPGFMYFGVFGIKDGVNRTSEVLTIRIVPGAITAEIAPADPTPDIYIQILSDYSTIKEQMVAVDQSTATSAAAAKLSADNAKQSENNVTAAETHVGEMKTEVEGLVNGFDTHVGEMKTEVDELTEECKTEIGNFKDGCKTEIDEFTEACKNEIDIFAGEQEGDLRKDIDSIPRPNLLINWYFENPVNQRGNTSYVKPNNYTIDGWKLGASGQLDIIGNGIKITDLVGDVYSSNFMQPIKADELPEGTYTFSALFDEVVTSAVVKMSVWNPTGSNNQNTGLANIDIVEPGLYSITFTLKNREGRYLTLGIRNEFGEANDYIVLKACKLERGSKQTLAHQDDAGNWVLNDIPNYGIELLKSQRYYHIYATDAERPDNGLDCVPTMRIENVSQGTISIDGKTYYYNSAEL